MALTDFHLAAAAKTLRIHLKTAVENGRFSTRQMAKDLDELLVAPEAEARRMG